MIAHTCPVCQRSMSASEEGTARCFACSSKETGEQQTLPPSAPPSEGATLPPAPVAGTTLPPADPFRTVAPHEGVAVPAAASPREVIPGYEILGELGRGGMGVVYKARQVKADRLVALKMILAGGHAGEADLARFRTEGEAIARLQHPNIVQVYEVGEYEGRPFFSLEFCTGGSLDRKLDGTPLPPKDAARLVETLARGMFAAHQAQVIHRDLKPANVLLTADGTPKITDFGLAKKMDDAGQTQSGSIMGTPSYMAPEQAGGRGKDMGPAADIYALGAILYELLTGRPPFKAATPLDTILQVVSDEPVPPSQLQSKTPRDLETICLKCLEKNPGKRYPAAEDLARDLRHYSNNEPIEARTSGPVERFRLWCCRPQRVPEAGVALIFFTVVLSIWCLLYHTIDTLSHLSDDLTDRAEWVRYLFVMVLCGVFQLPMLAVGWGTVRRKLPAVLVGVVLSTADLFYSAAGLVGFSLDPYGVFRKSRECEVLVFSLFLVLSCVWLAVYSIALTAYCHNRDAMRER